MSLIVSLRFLRTFDYYTLSNGRISDEMCTVHTTIVLSLEHCWHPTATIVLFSRPFIVWNTYSYFFPSNNLWARRRVVQLTSVLDSVVDLWGCDSNKIILIIRFRNWYSCVIRFPKSNLPFDGFANKRTSLLKCFGQANVWVAQSVVAKHWSRATGSWPWSRPM